MKKLSSLQITICDYTSNTELIIYCAMASYVSPPSSPSSSSWSLINIYSSYEFYFPTRDFSRLHSFFTSHHKSQDVASNHFFLSLYQSPLSPSTLYSYTCSTSNLQFSVLGQIPFFYTHAQTILDHILWS